MYSVPSAFCRLNRRRWIARRQSFGKAQGSFPTPLNHYYAIIKSARPFHLSEALLTRDQSSHNALRTFFSMLYPLLHGAIPWKLLCTWHSTLGWLQKRKRPINKLRADRILFFGRTESARIHPLFFCHTEHLPCFQSCRLARGAFSTLPHFPFPVRPSPICQRILTLVKQSARSTHSLTGEKGSNRFFSAVLDFSSKEVGAVHAKTSNCACSSWRDMSGGLESHTLAGWIA